MLTHQTNAQKFHCTYCPTVLTRKADLKQHMLKKHANDEDFVTCLKCDQEFADPSVLFASDETSRVPFFSASL